MAIQNLPIAEYKALPKSKKRDVRRRFKRILTKRRIEAKRHATPTENLVRKLLAVNGITYEFQKIIRQYRVDFYFKKIKTVLEIDGGYHNQLKTRIYDKYREEILLKNGKVKQIIRYTNEFIENNPTIFIDEIQTLIEQGGVYKSLSTENSSKTLHRITGVRQPNRTKESAKA
jgi:very-short-patch-repair endonuclease